MKVHRLHVEAVNEWTRLMTEQGERRTLDEARHTINQSVLPRPKAGPARTRPKVSRQQPQMFTLGTTTDYWGGDRNKLHFAMQHYATQHQPRLGHFHEIERGQRSGP